MGILNKDTFVSYLSRDVILKNSNRQGKNLKKEPRKLSKTCEGFIILNKDQIFIEIWVTHFRIGLSTILDKGSKFADNTGLQK